MNSRRTQMKWLIALTAISLMPVYGLLGWQTGPHGAKEVWAFIWTVEAVAWSLRALVEAWALVYLFSTNTDDPTATRALRWIEGALIGLIAVTVTLLIVANKSNQSINDLWGPLFWLWAASVASFAPLMFAGVGIAYKVQTENVITKPLEDVHNLISTLQQRIDGFGRRINNFEQQVNALQNQPDNPIDERRQRVAELYQSGLTQLQMADSLNVSIGTIRNDIKALDLNGR